MEDGAAAYGALQAAGERASANLIVGYTIQTCSEGDAVCVVQSSETKAKMKQTRGMVGKGKQRSQLEHRRLGSR